MPTKIEVLTRNAAKVIAALESSDCGLSDLEQQTGLNIYQLMNTVNYLKSERRIENIGHLLHLRPAEEPAPVEPSADPAPAREPEPTPVPQIGNGAQTIEPVMVTMEHGEVVSLETLPPVLLAPAPTPTLTATVTATGAERLAALIAERDALKAETARLRRLLDQKKRALRYVAAAGRINATYLALAKFESASTKAAVIAATSIDLPEPQWRDANVIPYLRKCWPHLTPEQRDEIAIRLLNEIVSGDLNNAWIELVRAYQTAAASEVQPCSTSV